MWFRHREMNSKEGMDKLPLDFTIDEALRQYQDSHDLLSLKSSISQVNRIPKENFRSVAPIRHELAIVSNYSTQFIAAALKPSLLLRGIQAEIFEEEFNQWEISPRTPNSSLYQFNPDIILFMLSSLALAFSPNSTPRESGERIVSVIRKVKELSRARILLTLPEPLAEETDVATWAYSWRSELLTLLEQELPKDCVTMTLEPLIRRVGAGKWYAQRYYILGKFSFHPDCTGLVADYAAAIIRNVIAPLAKLIIIDLDNTIWGGVVGEVGYEGVELNVADTGYGYLRLQKMLKYLKQNGVLLGIVSRNNYDDAIEVFRKRPEMILKESDFAAMEVNWDAKSRNIKRILEQLKLSSAGVVFLDDSPFEREEVKRGFPDIAVPQLAGDSADWVDNLITLGMFYPRPLSAEDSAKATLYAQEKQREEVQKDFADEREFLSSLELKVIVRNFRECEQRALDLIAKTNQFNLTSRRHSREDIEELIRQGGRVFVFALEDRFGNYGVISALIAVPRRENEYVIDSWVMSCRVIGRRAEQAMMEHVLSELREIGVKWVIGEYVATGKNALVANLYREFGFIAVSSTREGELFKSRIDTDIRKNLIHYCRIVNG